MKFNIKLWHKVVVVVAAPLVFEMAFIGILLNQLHEVEVQSRALAHSRAVISCAYDVRRMFEQALYSVFLYITTSSESAKKSLDEALDEMPVDWQRLKELVKDDPQQSALLARLDPGQAEDSQKLQQLKKKIALHESFNELFGVSDLRKQARKLSAGSLAMLDVIKLEKEKGTTDEKEEKLREQLKQYLIGGVILNLLLAAFLVAFFVSGTTRRLAVLMDNTLRLSTDTPLLAAVGGSDEIAHLDNVFHELAKSLEEASRKERAVVDNAQDVICLIDNTSKFTKVNPICATVWGYEASEIVGRRVSDIVIAEDLEATLAAFKSTKTGTGTNTASFENRLRQKQGTTAYMVWSVYWSADEQSLFCVVHDITDRKLSEVRVRALIDNMPVGLVVVDDNGLIESVNPKTQELFGYEEEELTGKELNQLLLIEKVSSPEAFVETIRKRTTGSGLECVGVRKAGEELQVELSLKEFETAVGKSNLVSIQDVSERHRIEVLKQEFVAMISHDLRTPLTSIQFTLALLAKAESDNLSDSWKERLARTERNCGRLVALINSLLDLERVRSGKLDLATDVCDLNSLIELAVDSVHGFAEKNGVALQANATSAVVLADSGRVVQVLVNLISNAIKFSPAGSAVTVTASTSEGLAEVKVVDHGRGVPASKLAEIFDRFAQVKKSDASEKGGTGLGLTICKAIIEAHGGTIGVESEEGKGSTFWFRIPLA